MFTANKDVAYSDTQLRVAFDGDAVLFSDESEQIVKEQGLDKFFEHEQLNENKPLAQVCTFWINDFSEHFFWFKFLLYFSSFPFLCVPFTVEAELLFRCPIYFLFQGLSLKCMFDSRETITTILSADQSLQRKKKLHIWDSGLQLYSNYNHYKNKRLLLICFNFSVSHCVQNVKFRYWNIQVMETG